MMTTFPRKPILKTLILNCKALNDLSITATVVVEAAIIDGIVSGENPEIFQQLDWFENTLLGQVFDDTGEIISHAQGDEYLSLLKDPYKAVEGYTCEIQIALDSFLEENDWTQLNLNHSLDVKSVKVARVYKDKWLLIIEGIPK